MHIHPKWYERHVRHLNDAMFALEEGDHRAACYNAYVSVEALAKGLLGYDPYGGFNDIKRLPALIKEAAGADPPEDVSRCAFCLENKAFGEDGEKCIKCAEVISNYLYIFLKAKERAKQIWRPY
ncbi:MAG: HEPN domain-containing protein [Thermoproteus sp.]